MRIVIVIFAILFHSMAWSSKKENASDSDLSKRRIWQGTIRKGDSLISILKRHQFSQKEIGQALQQNPLPRTFRFIPERKYLVVENHGTGKTGIKLFETLSDYSYFFWRLPSSQAGADKILEKYRKVKVFIKGQVMGSVLSSIKAKINSPWVASRFLDAYAFDTNMRRDLKKGADFSFVVEKQFLNDVFIKYGEVLNTSLEVKGEKRDRRYIKFENGGFFLDSMEPVRGKPLYAPVNYIRVTSKFQMMRFHPIRHKRIAHLGVDFELPTGSDVLATYTGIVKKIAHTRASGNHVILIHPNGYESAYLHLSSIAGYLREGQIVLPGEKIGAVGCTGYCTSPHLHFAIKKNGHHIDPLKVITRYPYNFSQLLYQKSMNL